MDPSDKSRNDAICSLFLHFHKRWFGRSGKTELANNPFFWPSAAMPNSVIDSWSGMVFLKFNGAKFSASDYPVLAKVFPSLVLPEARGDFIRIWDDGRGADGGRELLSWQAATNFSISLPGI